MKTFLEQARFYAQYHQKPITWYTHLAGVPLLLFSAMIFTGFFHFSVPGVFDITLASIGTLALWAYYAWLNIILSLLLAPIMALLFWLSGFVAESGPTESALWIFFAALILGAGFQLAGHFFEGKKPAFMESFWQALIAPLYLTAELCFIWGFMLDLKKKLHGDA